MLPDSSKVEVVTNWPKPKDEAEVRQFLGPALYYRKYINKFADIATPLHQLTQKGIPFQWTQKNGVISEAEGMPDRSTSPCVSMV